MRTETVPWARPGADALLELAEVLARSDRRDEARIVAAEAKRLCAEKGNAIALARATAAPGRALGRRDALATGPGRIGPAPPQHAERNHADPGLDRLLTQTSSSSGSCVAPGQSATASLFLFQVRFLLLDRNVARRQGDEDRRVGQRRVALVGPRRGVERSPAAGHESGRLPAVGRPLSRNSEPALTTGLAAPLDAAQPSTASASTRANAPHHRTVIRS